MIPEAVNLPIFLTFVDHYAKKFIAQNGFGRWLAEYQDMEARGLFAPNILRQLYIKILTDKFYLDFQKKRAVWYIGSLAQDAAEAYIQQNNVSQEPQYYKICVVTGETALDDDGDPFEGLDKEEAIQICKSLNDEIGEELFVIKKDI